MFHVNWMKINEIRTTDATRFILFAWFGDVARVHFRFDSIYRRTFDFGSVRITSVKSRSVDVDVTTRTRVARRRLTSAI